MSLRPIIGRSERRTHTAAAFLISIITFIRVIEDMSFSNVFIDRCKFSLKLDEVTALKVVLVVKGRSKRSLDASSGPLNNHFTALTFSNFSSIVHDYHLTACYVHWPDAELPHESLLDYM